MYLIIFDAALKAGPKLLTSSPYARYYIMSTRDVPVFESRTWLARALHKLGKIGTSELDRIKYEDAGPYAKQAIIQPPLVVGVPNALPFFLF